MFLKKRKTDIANMKLRILRLLLLGSAISWGISVFGVFLPWETSKVLLQNLGAEAISDAPMMEYWFRMTAGAFTAIGCFFLCLFLNPKRFSSAIPFSGMLLFFEGIILLFHGLRLGLTSYAFYGGFLMCLLFGGGIYILGNAVKPQPDE